MAELVIGLSFTVRVIITPHEQLSSPSSWRSSFVELVILELVIMELIILELINKCRNYKIVATSGKSTSQENLCLRLVEERTDCIATAQFDRGLIACRVGGQRDLCRRVSGYSRRHRPAGERRPPINTSGDSGQSWN
ncbi:MAG TPA: hypothetical protein VGY48_14835 [Vicinamibacterales bacterium]|nr:hypothetical protein [Vicinamibacterales bacterium]